MNDVVNLNRHRKRVAQSAKAITAAENRARFGQKKIDREVARQREARSQSLHDQHHLESGDDT